MMILSKIYRMSHKFVLNSQLLKQLNVNTTHLMVISNRFTLKKVSQSFHLVMHSACNVS